MAQNGTGGGPPEGSLHDSPFAQQIPASDLARRTADKVGGMPTVRMDDPAFQPPGEPLAGKKPSDARVVYRDIPLIASITEWNVDLIRAALKAHMYGIFEMSGQLVDAIFGDDRVHATLSSIISGLFGREVRFRPADDSIAAQEVCDAWVKCWPMLATAAAMTELEAYSTFMGWEPAQLTWGERDGVDYCPYLKPWHPRYTYYHWDLRRYIALSQDGQIPIMPGDAKWVLHAPYGEYRGWIRGAVRPVSFNWLMRQWALRDLARFGEVHGMPIKVGICPASAAEPERDAYANALAQLATETTLLITQGNDGANHYDFRIDEAKSESWQCHIAQRDHCDMAIVLAIMMQNLTTEVKGGSFAATEAHMDIRQGGIQYRNAAWRWTIRQQIARPFAWLNFGDPELAPITDWDVTPREEYEHNAKQFQQFGTAVEVLRRGGVEFVNTEELRKFAREKFGLDGLPDFTITEPVASGGGMGGGGGGFGK